MNPPPPKRRPALGRPAPDAASPPTEWIALGKIVAPFGLKGEVKLLPDGTDFPERMGDHPLLYLGPDHQPYTPLSVHPHGGVLLVRFEGIEDIDAAEPLRGMVVMIPASEAAPLPADQYYIHELIGLRALHINGTELGTVADVLGGAAQDLLVVRRIGAADVLVPLVKALVPTIDLANRTLIIDPPLGLFDDQWIEAE